MDEQARVRAPALEGALWLNSDRPLGLRGELRGKVVLLDFWTNGCINCLHVLAELRALEGKYPDALVVIGVHSPKFSADQDPEQVRAAVLRLGITHPVLCDPERRLASEYAVRAWPTLVLVDPEGYVVGTVSGEGHRHLLDQHIGEIVEEHRRRGTLDERPLRHRLERDGRPDQPLSFPGKVLADADSGRLFVADTGHHRIVIADLTGRVIDVAGAGAAGAADGGFEEASFRAPQGMTLAGRSLYVADTGNHLVRRVDLAARRVETLAGSGEKAGTGQRTGCGREVALSSPWDLVAADLPAPDGTTRRLLFVAMAGAHQVLVLDRDNAFCFPFAGCGEEGLVDGPRHQACFAQPSGLALHRRWLLVADSESSALRVIDLADESVSTAVGQGLFDFGDVDGDLETARLQHPLAVVADGPRVYLADTYNHKVKAVDLLERTVKTIAGDGRPGCEDGSPGRLDEPGGLSIARGQLYVADTGNHAVRVIEPGKGEVSTLVLARLSPPG